MVEADCLVGGEILAGCLVSKVSYLSYVMDVGVIYLVDIDYLGRKCTRFCNLNNIVCYTSGLTDLSMMRHKQ